ncbi:MAG: SH3 domain-containing protein [Anaerolineales bacterium]|nr:MAG: SH3 domain-containing protein [Anaerolineales bacterium]
MRRQLLVIVTVVVTTLFLPSLVMAQSGGLDLDGYCRSKGYSKAELVENNAYGWRCKGADGSLHNMDLYDACHWQYGGQLPTPQFSDFNNAYSWKCFGGNTQSPTIAPPSSGNSSGGSTGGSGNSGSGSGNSGPSGGSVTYYTGSSNSPSTGAFVQVSSSGLRIRTGPGTGYSILGQVVRGHYYSLLEQSGSWGKVDTNQGSGWISLDYVVTTQQNSKIWCSITPVAVDRGGGTFRDRNYELVYRGPSLASLMGPGTSDLFIYYRNSWKYLDYHGHKDGENIWGISTLWAYATPGWDDDSRWRIDFHWTGNSCP